MVYKWNSKRIKDNYTGQELNNHGFVLPEIGGTNGGGRRVIANPLFHAYEGNPE